MCQPPFLQKMLRGPHTSCLFFRQLHNACAYICGQLYLWLTVENPDLCISMYIYVRVPGGDPCPAGGWHTILSWLRQKIAILRHKIDVKIFCWHFLSVNYCNYYILQWFICPLSKYRQAHVSKIWHRVNLLTAKHTPTVKCLTLPSCVAYMQHMWHIRHDKNN